MVDIHSHILPGLDDGSKSLEQSVAMARLAAEHGTTDIVASPHANLEYKFEREVVETRIAELQAAIGSTLRVHYGCDFHLSYDNIQDAVAHPDRYSINHKGYLLVEFSDLTIFHTTTSIFDQLLNAGMVPIITHPERNQLLQARLKELSGWVDMGCLIQVTAQSFLGRFGNRARTFSETLMKNHLVHFLASDAHNLESRPPVLDETFQFIAKHYGSAAANRMLVDNPRAVIEGSPVERGPYAEETVPKKWYQFWG